MAGSESLDTVKAIKLLSNISKIGVIGVLCVVVYWMNGRLTKVEQRNEYLVQRLFECLGSRAEAMPAEDETTEPEKITAAILPEQRRKLYYYETVN